MTATLNDVAKKKAGEPSAEQRAAVELVRLAKEQGLALTGPDGLLKQLTKTVLETALNEEITEHLGYEKHDPAGAGSGNIRNGTRARTVLTEASGEVAIDVPRDRAGTFEPQIVRKRQRRLSGVDEVVLSLYAKGLTTGIYGASVSKETVSRITDKVLEEMNDWAVRPLDAVYAAVFTDAIVVKVRAGQVANRPFYAAIGVTLAGERDILGLWAGTGGEGAKFWMSVLTDLRNRGVRDVFFVVCDGLKGLPEVVSNVWPAAIVQTCIIHLIRNTFRLASRRDAAGRLLLTRRVDNGLWVLPGGKLELGETIAQAAAREVLEETGVEVEVTGIAGIYTDPGHVIAYGDGTVLQEFSVLLHARAVGGEARADGTETSAVRWVDPAELPELDLHPVMRQRIADALDPAGVPRIA